MPAVGAIENQFSGDGPVRGFGRLLQIVGLVVPPLSIVMQLWAAITQGQMLTMLVASVCCWGIGRIIEGYAR
jgi:F0F1-type ATP synthase membrane subunit a